MGISRSNLLPDSMHKNNLSLEHIMLVLSQEHTKETAKDLMCKHCLQTSSETLSKQGMEFLYMNGFYKELNWLITKNMASENPSNNMWAFVYQLVMERRQERISPREIIRQANHFKHQEPELDCLIAFIKITAYYNLNDYARMGHHLEDLPPLLEKMEDKLLVSFFKSRMYQSLFIYYWMRNELIIARKFGFRAMNMAPNPRMKINIHINLGLSYCFDTYYQGMYHLSEALKIAGKHNFTDAIHNLEQRNIPFLSAKFKQTKDISTEDKSEQAHLEIAKGNYKKARLILKDLPINTPFRLYYLGLAKQDRQLVLQSYNQFIEDRSDFFFSRLPLQALQDWDEKPV